MKKILILAIALVAAGILPAQELTLNEAIARAARGIEETLPQGTLTAVLNFESPAKAFSDFVIEELTSELLEAGKIPVVDRRNIALIRQEMNLQLSGDVNDESALSIGKMLGVHYIISGTITDMGAHYRFRTRIINVETAAIQRQITIELKKDAQVAYLLGNVSAQKEIEREQRREQRQIEESLKTANVKNNWLSTGVTGTGILLRYERMLNAKLALGADAYFNFVSISFYTEGFHGDMDFGTDITMRLYPWGKIFYIGADLGFHGCFDKAEVYFDANGNKLPGNKYYDPYSGETYEIIIPRIFFPGFAITPELGFKIDLFKSGGFFIDIGIKIPLVITENKGLIFSILPYAGVIGWAF